MESNFQREMIGESRQYMVLNKHTWDNKSVKSCPRDQVLLFHSTSNIKNLFPPYQLKPHSRTYQPFPNCNESGLTVIGVCGTGIKRL